MRDSFLICSGSKHHYIIEVLILQERNSAPLIGNPTINQRGKPMATSSQILLNFMKLRNDGALTNY